ncbi:DoxX family membrane protein [Neobacillus notoginsengisoli]|uniref:DoxX family membrane protein n=1 Tax=Neobacillus notoginsengisoli TaxID=1578198 RepID=A0A417YX78_9BACI|nr:DoxX family membrane protein [Neobacillus notoginsengisoli]RHW42207.1 DoxX family membrane protein [Neobacillus notoginsengisoli]
MKKRTLFYLLFAGLTATPLISAAHVKWFTEAVPQKAPIEEIISPVFISISIGAALILAALPQLLPWIMKWKPVAKIDRNLEGLRKYSRVLLKYGTAAALIIQVLMGTIFAPEIHIPSIEVTILVWLAIGLLITPHHYATKAGSLILLGLFIYITPLHGLFHMLDYGFYLAIIFVLLIGNTRLEQWGFPFLYLGTGLSLCWVAVEKWVFPGLSLDIIANHHVPTFGFPPEIFVVLSAFIEFVVGYLLVVGVLNRLLAFVLTCLFILTTTLFGWLELAGHFMIHIILAIFIIEGVSFYKPPISIHKTVADQVVFVFLNFIFVLATFLMIYYRFA